MTTTSIRLSGDHVLAAWENDEQVFFAEIGMAPGRPVIAPADNTDGRKHPVAVGNARGETLLAWAEGTAWNRGGSLAWQLFDAEGDTTDVRGTTPSVPVWGLPTAFAEPDGSFAIVY